MIRPTSRSIWLALGASSIGLALMSVLLTEWLRLDPCHLCIFQRLLFFVMGALALGAALAGTGLVARILGGATLISALGGMATAAYQSWFQLQPPGSAACAGGQLGLIERGVEWLGQQLPTLFLATGFCEDVGVAILGLSLANWALIGFAISVAITLWALSPRAIAER